MTTRERIILETRLWRMEKENLDSSYFNNLAPRARPSILWVEPFGNVAPVAELINTEPGDILVYRSAGGLCRPDDLNLMAVLEQFLEHEGTEYIVVCGHTHCKAIKDVIAGVDAGPYATRWLEEIHALYKRHAAEMTALSPRQQERKLGELNVREQLLNLKELEVVQAALSKGDNLVILGWYLDLAKGDVQELCSLTRRDMLVQAAASQLIP
jgi:carbonic anhydrase